MLRHRITLLLPALILAALPLTATWAARGNSTAPGASGHSSMVRMTGHVSALRHDDSVAELETTSYLPTSGFDDQVCIDRSLYLDAGNYDWTVFMGEVAGSGRELYLDAGTYVWEACVIDHAEDYYFVESTLEVPGHNPAGYLFPFAPDLETTWGSSLSLLS